MSGEQEGEDSMDETLTIGELVRRRRRGLGMTQAQFATMLGVHQITLARWESDQQKPKDEEALLRLLEKHYMLPKK